MGTEASNRISVEQFHEYLKDELQLTWVAGHSGAHHYLEAPTWHGDADAHMPPEYASAQAGGLSFVHPNRVQVLGGTEMDYLRQQMTRDPGFINPHSPFAPSIRVLIFAEDQAPPPIFLQVADDLGVSVFRSPLPAGHLVAYIQHWLARALAERETVHGVFMDVLGMGVLLLGEPGIGKSELALELLSHGHRLIADDAVDFAHTAPDVVVGSCPPAILDHLEVRGLGIINIRDMFGAAAILRSKRLRLAIELKRMSVTDMAAIDRLRGNQDEIQVAGVSVPRVTLPVTPGRNLAVMVEVAARNQFLKESGVDTLAQFEEQIRRSMRETAPDPAADR